MQAVLAHVTELNSSWVITVVTFRWETPTESLKISRNQLVVLFKWFKLQVLISLKPRANGHNIACQQLPIFLDVTCVSFSHPVACCCVLLGVAASGFKPVKRSTTCKRTQQLPTLSGQQCWELLRPRTERQYFCLGVAWGAGAKKNLKKRKYSKKTASSELKSFFAVCFNINLYGYVLAIRLSHAQISASLDPGQPHPQASSRNPSERRRLGTERQFSQQAWQVTSHSNSQRTTGNDAGFLRCLIPILISWCALKYSLPSGHKRVTRGRRTRKGRCRACPPSFFRVLRTTFVSYAIFLRLYLSVHDHRPLR